MATTTNSEAFALDLMAVLSAWPWDYEHLEIRGDKYNFIKKDGHISVQTPQRRAEPHSWKRCSTAPKTAVPPKNKPPRFEHTARSPHPRSPKENTVTDNKVLEPRESVKHLVRNCVCSCENAGVSDRKLEAGAAKNGDKRTTLRNSGLALHNTVSKSNVKVDFQELPEVFTQSENREKSLYRDDKMRVLVEKFGGAKVLTHEETIQLLKAMVSDNGPVQEATLLLIQKLSKHTINAHRFLDNGLLEELIYLVLLGSSTNVQTHAVLCITKLVACEEHTSLWLEPMVISGTEALLGVLSAEHPSCPSSLAWAVLEALTSLAKNAKMAAGLIQYGLRDVIGLTTCKTADGRYSGNPITQGLAVEFLTHLIFHDQAIVESFLSKYIEDVERIVDILQFSPCKQQQEALRFLAALAMFTAGLAALVTHHALEHTLFALTSSCCRDVRELASKTLKIISSSSDKTLVLTAFSQICDSSSSPFHSKSKLVVSSVQTKNQRTLNKEKHPVTSTPSVLTSRRASLLCIDYKMIKNMSKEERTVAELASSLVPVFQIDSLEETGKDRNFFGSDAVTTRPVSSALCLRKYESSLRVKANVLATFTNVLDSVEHETAAGEDKERVMLLHSALLVQCGALGCLDQFNSLSKKLLKVNQPSFHNIDPTILPPKELFGMKTGRSKLLFKIGSQKKEQTGKYPDFRFNQFELYFVREVLAFVLRLSKIAAGSGFQPSVEDVNVFQDNRPKPPRRRRRVSFRRSAVLVKNAVTFTQRCARRELGGDGQSAVTGSMRSHTSHASTLSAETVQRKTSQAAQEERPPNELDTDIRDTREAVHYIKQRLLNSKIVECVAPWITCGVWDIQDRILQLLRCLFHQNNSTSTPSASTCPDFPTHRRQIPVQAYRSTTSLATQRSTESAGYSLSRKAAYISHVCVRQVIQQCGPYLLDLLSPPASPGLGKSCLMVIKAAVCNGEQDTRLKLVRLGCFGQVIEFIRGNDEETAKALGVLMIRVLVTSDHALQQLFIAHGGMKLVMALHEYEEALVKEEAAHVLKTFKTALQPNLRHGVKTSAHKKRAKPSQASGGNRDIWERVAMKWEAQDQVQQVLKKFNVRY